MTSAGKTRFARGVFRCSAGSWLALSRDVTGPNVNFPAKPTFCLPLCLAGVLACCSSEAALVVNEVMANEPGSYVALEWVEIYNNSSTVVRLEGYRLEVDNEPIDLPDSVCLDSGEYYVVCRKLFLIDSTDASPGFENVWGDNSNVWGDTPEEHRLQTPYETPLSLKNQSGTVGLYNPAGFLTSELRWSEAGKDGFSWERLYPESLETVQSVDPDGSTPGFVNSLTPVPNDLALEEVGVVPNNGAASVTFTVVNHGLNSASDARLFLCPYSGDGEGISADTLDAICIAEIEPGSTFITTRQYFFDGIYVSLSASLPDDDRPRGNRLDFVATGVDFPPVVLSELLANPQAPLQTEWAEVRCRAHEPFDMAGWQLGDSLALHAIIDSHLIMDPNEYAVLTNDSLAFLDFYQRFDRRCLQPDHWPRFNNDHDVVRLVDSFGFEADRFAYAKVFNDNHTWSRGKESGHEDDWGRSAEMGGSPGRPNTVLFEPAGSQLAVSIEPSVFSPDGDGVEDVAVITVEEAPAGAAVTMRVYDRQGRAVRTLIDGESLLSTSYTWDGRSDGGRRLPIGIYILYLEAVGSKSVKTPIVIAR